MANSSMVPIEDLRPTENTIKALIGTATFPDRYEDFADALATILVGKEMGLPPITALNELFVVGGRVGMEGKLMLALIYRAGHKIHIKLSKTGAEVTAYRWDSRNKEFYEAGVFTFDEEDARTANLWDKQNYQEYPTDMLGWKAVARAARFVYPDIITGGHTPDDVGFDDVPLSLWPTDTEYVDDIESDESEVLDIEGVADVLDAEIVVEPAED